jgi:hypothetical protein
MRDSVQTLLVHESSIRHTCKYMNGFNERREWTWHYKGNDLVYRTRARSYQRSAYSSVRCAVRRATDGHYCLWCAHAYHREQ